MNESCPRVYVSLVLTCSMTHPYSTITCVPWLFLPYYTTHSYMYVSLTLIVCMLWLFLLCDMTHACVSLRACRDCFFRMTQLIHMSLLFSLCVCYSVMTLSSMWHDSFICLSHSHCVYVMNHSSMGLDSFICLSYCVYVTTVLPCDITHSYVSYCVYVMTHSSCDTTHLCVSFIVCVSWLVLPCGMTHSYVSLIVCMSWLILPSESTPS